MSYLTKMTVVELKAVADRMATPYASRVKKADLISAIEADLSVAYDRAMEDAEFMAQTEIGHTVTDTQSEIVVEDMKRDDNLIPTYTLRDDNGAELTTVTGDPALIMNRHVASITRFNPTMKRDRNGKIILTAKQRRRVHKKDRSFARSIGFLSPKGA